MCELYLKKQTLLSVDQKTYICLLAILFITLSREAISKFICISLIGYFITLCNRSTKSEYCRDNNYYYLGPTTEHIPSLELSSTFCLLLFLFTSFHNSLISLINLIKSKLF